VLGVTPNFRRISKVPMRGRLDAAALAAGGVVISDDQASSKDCTTSSTGAGTKIACDTGRFLPLRFPTSKAVEVVPVAGVYTDDKALGSNTDYIIGFRAGTGQWEQRFTTSLDQLVLVRKPPGVTNKAAGPVVRGAAKQVGGIDAQNKTQFKDKQLQLFNQILGLVYVLLAFAVLIAFIGIINTLALSIYERTREIGLLRAVGMSRVQLRRMIRGESVVVAVFGSLLGLGVGVLFGVALVTALESEGIELTMPIGQLVIFVVLAGLLGLLAGTFPARRAARLDVLDAVSHD